MRKIKKIISSIFLIIVLSVLFINGVILTNSYINPNKIPSFFDWKTFIVLTGSMESEIYPGDIVVVKEVDNRKLKEGDIIAFKNDEIVVTHRIIKIDEGSSTKYITKGDNNNTEDSEYVLPEQIEGLYQFKISGLGNLIMFIQTPIGIIICFLIPLTLLILIQIVELRKSK